MWNKKASDLRSTRFLLLCSKQPSEDFNWYQCSGC